MSANAATLIFDRGVYSVAAVKKAAYRYIDSFAVDISVSSEKVECVLHFELSADQAARESLIRDFRKEVLDQDLRERLKVETEAVRNLILAHAFSKTGLAVDEQVSKD